MPTGVLINVSSVIVGGIVGGIAGKKLSAEFKTQITLIFGVCSMSMGIFTLGLMQNMPAVVFAVVIGTGLGLVLKLGKWINHGASLMEKPIAAMAKSKESTLSQEEVCLRVNYSDRFILCQWNRHIWFFRCWDDRG
ncbi:MAG: DUF554 family protein [Enterococcus casseliflavus]